MPLSSWHIINYHTDIYPQTYIFIIYSLSYADGAAARGAAQGAVVPAADAGLHGQVRGATNDTRGRDGAGKSNRV